MSNQKNKTKIALPKGRLLEETARMLEAAGWGLKGYTADTRSYRLQSERYPGLLAKIFHERDIPVQVAIGNYDIGICGLDWLQELMVKYPSSPLIKLRDFNYGAGSLYMVASRSGECADMDAVCRRREIIRLVSEYPNLAESFAIGNRLRRFSVFSLWGAAEAYPPESAELALMRSLPGDGNFNHDLVPVENVLDFNACLIVNRDSWERTDLSEMLSSIDSRPFRREVSPPPAADGETSPPGAGGWAGDGAVRLALADGHQQKPTAELLRRAGITVEDYPGSGGNRRPSSSLEGVAIKVIRPQDMPGQVATGNFDLAITGRDWLREHLYQFPSSPVTELLDLKMARVRIVAVVSKGLEVADLAQLRQLYEERGLPVRLASEYVNIADKCARDNHFGVYKVIPTWGATEAFLPEDADLMIENTETGNTIARHNLKIIDELFVSTGCLIGNTESLRDPAKGETMKSVTGMLRQAVK